MDSLDEFKNFVRQKPEISSWVLDGKYNWQQLYEMFTMYGKDHEIWQQMAKPSSPASNIDLLQLLKNIDIETLIAGMQGLEKILDLVANYLESNQLKRFDD